VKQNIFFSNWWSTDDPIKRMRCFGASGQMGLVSPH